MKSFDIQVLTFKVKVSNLCEHLFLTLIAVASFAHWTPKFSRPKWCIAGRER